MPKKKTKTHIQRELRQSWTRNFMTDMLYVVYLLLCGHHYATQNGMAESRQHLSWKANRRAFHQGLLHPKLALICYFNRALCKAQRLTLRMSSRKAFLSPLNWVTLGPFSSLLACTLSSLREDRHRANTASPLHREGKGRQLASSASPVRSIWDT